MNAPTDPPTLVASVDKQSTEFEYEKTIVTHEFESNRRYITIGMLNGRRIARKTGYSPNELEIMLLLRSKPHPGLIQLIEVDLEEQCLVMEGIKDGLTLRRYYSKIHVTAFTLPEVILMTKQMTSALEHLHKHNIIHHDLKYNNVLVELGSDSTSVQEIILKICDFGLSEVVDGLGHGSEKHQGSGTGYWRAPEQLTDDPTIPVTMAIDIYALGIIISYITHHGRTTDQSNFTIPMRLLGLIERCQHDNPIERPSSSQLLLELDNDELVDGWSLGDEIDSLVNRCLDAGKSIPIKLEQIALKVATARGIILIPHIQKNGD